MKQFTFEATQKKTLVGVMALGLLCLALSYFTEPAQITEAGFHSRFWSNFLHNAAFFTGMAFMITFVLAAFTTAYAGWHVVFKRIWEAFTLFLLPGLALLAIVGIGNYAHLHHLYHWTADGITDPSNTAYDAVLAGKSGFLNNHWYLLGTLLLGGGWTYFAYKFRGLSLREDAEGHTAINFSFHRKTRFFAALFLPIAAFTGPAMVWQWIMSVDAHWYSTLFAWYTMASWFLGAASLTIMLLIYLKSKGYYEQVTREHLHDLGKYMFAFSIFWTYCWFSQYMLIWYGNVGEETIYFRQRLDSYPVLFYGNLVINFALPFLILMRNTTKRRYGTLMFSAALVFVGHWMDFFLMIKPGVLITAQEALHHGADGAQDHGHGAGFVDGFTLPGLLELGIFLGFTALFIYFVFSQLEKAALVPKNDPYLGESLHHEVQPYE
jgi:hypothetical protein